MPRSPYRKSPSRDNPKRDYRAVEKYSQDRYYNNEPRKKVQHSYDYEKPRQSRDDEKRSKHYDNRKSHPEPYEEVPVIRIDTNPPPFRRGQRPSEIRIHFRFKPIKLKLDQKSQIELKTKLRNHIHLTNGPVLHFERSADSYPGNLILELGFEYDQDALNYLGQSELSFTIQNEKVTLSFEPSKIFKQFIEELNQEKKKSKHEERRKSRSRTHSPKKEKSSKHKKKRDVSSSSKSSLSTPSKRSRKSHDRRDYHKDRKEYKRQDRKSDYKEDRKDYKEAWKNQYKDDRKNQHRQHKDDRKNEYKDEKKGDYKQDRKNDYKEDRKSDYKEDRKNDYKDDRKNDYKEQRRAQYRRQEPHRDIPQRQSSKQDRRQPYQRQRPRESQFQQPYQKPRIQQRIKDAPAPQASHQRQQFVSIPAKPAQTSKQTENKDFIKEQIALYFFGIHYSVNNKDMDNLFREHKDGPFVHKELIWRQMKDSICVFLEGRFEKKHGQKLLEISDKLQVKGHPFVIIDSESTEPDKLLQKIAQYQINIQFPRKIEPYHLLKGLKECGRVVQIMSNNKLSEQGGEYYNVTFNSKEVCMEAKMIKKTSNEIIIEEVSKENALFIYRPNSKTELMTVDYESENGSNASPKRDFTEGNQTQNQNYQSRNYYDNNQNQVGQRHYERNYDNKYSYNKNYDNRNYDNRNYYQKNYDNNYNNKNYENKNYENKSYDNKGYDKNYDRRNRDKSYDEY